MNASLTLVQLLLASALLLINFALSWRLKLGLTRDMIWATVRMVVQLLLVGLILNTIFALHEALPVVLIGLMMTGLAAHAALGRVKRRYRHVFIDSFIAIFGSSFLLTGYTLLGILHLKEWFEPQYAIPLLGMILGNSLTGISLALDRFTSDLTSQRATIENLLSLGATRWEATQVLIKNSIRTGLIPLLNSMAVMGVVSLPGMMTGQILAGTAPAIAVRYQIMIVMVLAASNALGSTCIVLLAYRRLLDPCHRLRLERLKG